MADEYQAVSRALGRAVCGFSTITTMDAWSYGPEKED